jgi:hypothetical protein
MDDIYIGSVVVYVERDKEGYVSLSTDGYPGGEGLEPIIAALRALQTDDDREYGSAMNARNNRRKFGG